MSAASDSTSASTTPVASTKRRRRGDPSATPANLQAVGQASSGEANRRAAAILEVLAGARTPGEAAEALGVSLPHFYLLERKALEGLVRACEVQPKGAPPPGAVEKLALVEQQLAAAQRECQRLAALVRVTQRAVGLPARAEKTAAKSPGKTASGKSSRRRRKPSVRALRAAQAARQNAARRDAGDLPAPAEMLERMAVGNGSSSAPATAVETTPPPEPSRSSGPTEKRVGH